MFDIVIFAFWAALANFFDFKTAQVPPLEALPWHQAELFTVPKDDSDLLAQTTIDKYLQKLESKGISASNQGVWLQSNWQELGSHQGTTPLSAASLTKIATTLAVIDELGMDHLFETKVYAQGKIQEGVLQGDLIVIGDRDPFFVWEEAIALAHSLNELGITKITGNLLVSPNFYMNYEVDAETSAQLLYKGLNPSLWTTEVQRQFQQMPITLPLPGLVIQGQPKLITQIPTQSKLLIIHKSLPMVDILRQMNIYSNNYMAQALADIVGGADKIAEKVRKIVQVPPQEIQLINGSGLGVENMISPRAATKMLIAIEDLVKPLNLSVTDLFPVAGRDLVGTMENRQIPDGIGVKTGTLNQVSALAGLITLEGDRQVWFAAINQGWQIRQFRQEQDKFLQHLTSSWKVQTQVTKSSPEKPDSPVKLGDPTRNQLYDQANYQ